MAWSEPTAAAEQAWVASIADKSMLRHDFLLECTPGYYNNEGKLGGGGFSEVYGGGPLEFYEILRAWREEGEMNGLVFD